MSGAGNPGLRILLLVVAVAVWEGLVPLLAIPIYVLPTPSGIAVALYRGIVSFVYIDNLWAPLTETILGFIAGCAFAFLLGTGVALSRRFEYYLYPFIVMFQSLPKVAVVEA